jgi:negative regulator of sigma E activity
MAGLAMRVIAAEAVAGAVETVDRNPTNPVESTWDEPVAAAAAAAAVVVVVLAVVSLRGLTLIQTQSQRTQAGQTSEKRTPSSTSGAVPALHRTPRTPDSHSRSKPTHPNETWRIYPDRKLTIPFQNSLTLAN